MSRGHFHLGKRVGEYIYYDVQGYPVWKWEYKGEKAVYQTYHSHSEKIRTICTYVGRMADGVAQTLDRDGKVTAEVTYEKGRIVDRTNLQIEPPAPMGEIF